MYILHTLWLVDHFLFSYNLYIWLGSVTIRRSQKHWSFLGIKGLNEATLDIAFKVATINWKSKTKMKSNIGLSGLTLLKTRSEFNQSLIT